MSRTADAVVIGAGVNGASVAYHLAKRGVKKVLLLERRFPASGPTGRSSGVVRQHYTIETLARMALNSLRTFQRFADEVGGSAGFVQSGVVFAVSEEGVALLRKNVEMQQHLGIHTEILSARELVELDPFLFHDDLAAGAYEPESGYADPALTTNSFVEAAQRLGVQLCPRTMATELKVEQERILSVIANGEEISTRTVVNVAGPWGAQVAALAGADIPITPTRHAVVLMQRPPQWRISTPVWADLVTGFYFKPEGLSKILVGSIREEESQEQVDPDMYCSTVDYETTAAYAEHIIRRFPIMAEGTAQGGWAGVYDVTPDWLPVIDEIPNVKGLYCAVGFSGHGFKLAPAVGTILAELVLEGKCSSYDISVFQFARFHERRFTHSKYEYKILG